MTFIFGNNCGVRLPIILSHPSLPLYIPSVKDLANFSYVLEYFEPHSRKVATTRVPTGDVGGSTPLLSFKTRLNKWLAVSADGPEYMGRILSHIASLFA